MERLQEPGLFRNNWVKSSLCLGLILVAIFFPIFSAVVLHSIIFSDPFKIWAIICGIALMYLLVPVTVWVVIRWGLSLTNAEARYWLKRRLTQPLMLINIPVQLVLVVVMFLMLWMVLN
ncbi:MAG: hypothetical protein F4W92_04160 [Gammaproteobacteria bacterium]|nr:hypothetical protein [Gammaproteobacteria bacterium]